MTEQLKEATVEAEAAVENLKAELGKLESAEEVDKEAVKAKKAEIRAAEKAKRDADKALDKAVKAAAREAEKAEKAAAREAEKAEKAAAREAAKEAKKAEREAAKKAKAEAAAAKKAEREANRMPEQNGIRRPKPDTLCGQAWGIADNLSAELDQPVPIKQLLEATTEAGLNPGNVKAEYARWRKFHGVTGRITLPKQEEPTSDEAAA